MELVNLEEQVYPVKKATTVGIQEFIDKELDEMYKFMQQKKIPFLHCIQVGINKDIFIWRRQGKLPGLVINPKAIVRNRKDVKYVPECCFSYPRTESTFRTFATIRATKVLGVFDVYGQDGKLKKSNETFYNAEAGAFQQMADLSQGKLILRFEEVQIGSNTEETVEGSLTEAKEII